MRAPLPLSGAAAAALDACPALREVTLFALRLANNDGSCRGPGIAPLASASSTSLVSLHIGINTPRLSTGDSMWFANVVDSPASLAGVIKHFPSKFPHLSHLSIAMPTAEVVKSCEAQRPSPWAKAAAPAPAPAAVRNVPWGAAAVASAPMFERGVPFHSLTSLELFSLCEQAPDGLAPSIDGLVAPKLKKLAPPGYTYKFTKLKAALDEAVSSGRCPVLQQSW